MHSFVYSCIPVPYGTTLCRDAEHTHIDIISLTQTHLRSHKKQLCQILQIFTHTQKKNIYTPPKKLTYSFNRKAGVDQMLGLHSWIPGSMTWLLLTQSHVVFLPHTHTHTHARTHTYVTPTYSFNRKPVGWPDVGTPLMDSWIIWYEGACTDA